MGRPLPGYAIELIDPASGGHGDQGEICIDLARRPLGLMVGYRDRDQNDEAMRDGFYHTGDVASRDGDGYITYIGRSDDVFKSSDYRISPFELESVLIEHPAVAEAAVVPSPDADPPRRAEGIHRGGRGARTARMTSPARSSSTHADEPRRLQAGAPPRVRGAAENRVRKDPARRPSREREACCASSTRTPRRARVLGRGLSRAALRRRGEPSQT